MVLSFAGALQLILQHSKPLSAELTGLEALVGRVSAEDIAAPWDLPRWDNSEMDGFAVRTADCKPFVRLKVDDFLPAGASAEGVSVKRGTAVRIMTGAPIPTGGDAIVPIEHTVHDNASVTINNKVCLGDYIRFRGSDIPAGEVLIKAGTVLRPAEINLLASFSRMQARVYRRPRVAILSTGDELVPPGASAGRGQISDSNAYSLMAAIQEIGAEALLLGIAQDNLDSLRGKVAEGLRADVLITSAGVSSGDRDLVREVLDEAGVRRLFWKVNIKPGGPTAFGLKGEKLVFSLPGNPVSSMIGFEQLVRPALLRLMGHEKVIRSVVKARVKSSLVNETKKLRFLRVKATETPEGLFVESAGNQNTGILKTMIRANAIAILPPDCSRLSAGALVDIQLLNPEAFAYSVGQVL